MIAWLRMGVLLLVALTLTRFIPFSAFFRNVNTLVHEAAHAAVTLLLSGKVMYIHLFADQSGVTYSAVTDNWMTIPISLAGYPGSALFAMLLFRLYAVKRERFGLIVIAAIAVLSLILFVRNGYGLIWCAGFAIITVMISFASAGWLRSGYYLLIAFICLVESVVSAMTIVWIAVMDPAGAGDAANLASVLIVPAPVWAVGFLLFALLCAKRSATLLVRARPARQPASPK